MDEHLADRDWFVGERPSLADIALYAYTHVCEAGGFRLRRLSGSLRLARPGRARCRAMSPMDVTRFPLPWRGNCAYIARGHGRPAEGRPFYFHRRETVAQPTPLMPHATASWLVDNTALSFEQIAEFCGLHILEVQAMADDLASSQVHRPRPGPCGRADP